MMGLLRAMPLWLVLVLLVCGCEEDVTAVLGTERAFSLYGVVTPEVDTQFVRVFPIEDRLQTRPPEPLDARFTSTDLETGDVRVWQDSIIQEASGLYEHAFWSPFGAEYGHTYRLEVERSDGATSWVDAAVPPPAELVPQAASLSRPVGLPVLVQGDVPHLLNIEVEYLIKFDEGPFNLTTSRVVFPFQGTPVRGAGGWTIRIDLSRAATDIRESLQRGGQWNASFGVVLLEMTLRLIAANEAWNPPGGVFDPEVLVQPGTMSNVENGFGFVGAGYRLEHTWLPEADVLDAAGFRPFQQPARP